MNHIEKRHLEAILFVGIGGFLGANVRYLLSGWITQQLTEPFAITFPVATLIINFSGSLLLAAFVIWSSHRLHLSPNVRLFMTTGFCGGYTTYSTFANDTVALVQVGNWLGAAGNIFGTNILCLLGVVLGMAVGSRL